MTDSAMKLSIDFPPEAEGRSPIKRSIRRLAAFSHLVDHGLAQFNRRYGTDLTVSSRQLTRAFLEWVRRFDAQRELADRDRRDFSHFAAGLLFSSFIRNRPVQSAAGQGAANELAGTSALRPEERLIAFWPEGVFYFEFCITVLDKVLAEQSLEGIHLAPQAVELRSWQSFRENVQDDPNLAIPFLDLFLGGDPNWDYPTAARFRSALQGHFLGADRRLTSN
ncbi:hypothetical protein [Aureimonas sp. AU20]|uniref:hypothetical protein n=1 Tax=Aureimonas sp. AU20 TaxID=1349819 RepID=UPI00071EA1A3|nr:hypothetical protein [Aureimonas sp. AU20]ALN72436.1 hypothetical protein M673_06895 [Aureimonas sp. AU20]